MHTVPSLAPSNAGPRHRRRFRRRQPAKKAVPPDVLPHPGGIEAWRCQRPPSRFVKPSLIVVLETAALSMTEIARRRCESVIGHPVGELDLDAIGAGDPRRATQLIEGRKTPRKSAHSGRIRAESSQIGAIRSKPGPALSSS